MPSPSLPFQPSCKLSPGLRLNVESLGLSFAEVLCKAGLTPELADLLPVKIPLCDYFRFWQVLSAQYSQGPVGLAYVQEAVQSSLFDPPLLIALSSRTFAEAMQRLSKYKRLFFPENIQLQLTADEVTVSFVWPACELPLPTAITDKELAFVLKLGQYGTRTSLQPLRLLLQRPELAWPEAFAERFGCPIILQAEHNGIVFSRADFERPFVTANQLMVQMLEAPLDADLAREQVDWLPLKVKSLLRERLVAQAPSLDEVANALLMSRRSLQRELKARQTSYQALLTDTRRELASHYLRKTATPISEIAFLMNYIPLS